MKYGPGRTPVQLDYGDEVPAPVKKTLLQRGWVVEVEQVSGRSWADACEARDAKELRRIESLPDGPEKDQAVKLLERVMETPVVAPTVHETQVVRPEASVAPRAKTPRGKERKNRAAIDAMPITRKKLEAARDYVERESEKPGAQERVAWLMGIEEQLRKSEVAGSQASETVPAAPGPAATAKRQAKARGRSRG
jgi:hypothetical protein